MKFNKRFVNGILNIQIFILKKTFSKIFFCLAIVNLCYKDTNAQQFNNWVFPFNNGLTFNTNPPSSFSGTQISAPLPPPYFTTYSTAASISDNNGQLLFYSDGVRVWNKNNVLMPNGFGLQGYLGQINTALIIPFINDPFKYYLFTAQGLAASPQPDTNKYSYSVIDMQLDGGLGDVVNKNTLIKNFATEKMVAIPAANGNDIWWIGRDWTNHFYSYKITCQGFQNSNPVISTVGSNTNNSLSLLFTGDVKASPDGKYITVSYGSYFEIYQFNNATGVLSNPIKIPAEYCYGVEFSPNSKFLYTTQIFNLNSPSFTSDVVQYSMAIYDSVQILNSLVKVSQMQPGAFRIYQGGLQLGPNNKIYLCGVNDRVLSTVNRPDIAGLASDFQDSILTLPNPTWRRFPYCYVNLISAQNVQINYTVAADCRTVTFTGKTYIKGNNLTFKWKWGEPAPVAGTPLDSATQVVASLGDTTYATIVHTYPPGQDTFFVNLTVSSDTLCGTGRAGVRVVLLPSLPAPTANFGYTATCNSLTVPFSDSSLLNTNPGLSYTYAWKPTTAPASAYINFSTQPNPNYTFAVYDSFDVRLIVKGIQSCAMEDTIVKRIGFTGMSVASFTANDTCVGKTITIINNSIPNNPTVTYLWTTSDGQTSTALLPNFSFATSGTKTIQLKLSSPTNACVANASQTISIDANPVAAFDITEACLGKPVAISNNSTGTIASYIWQTSNAQQSNSIVPTFIFDTAGTYSIKLDVATANNCSATITKSTPVQPVRLITRPAVDTNVNVNQPLQINISGADIYSWTPFTNLTNAGSSNPVFKSTAPGIYPLTVQATTVQGCKASDTIIIKVFATGEYLFIPNAFTPNGDSRNDQFNFTCSGLRSLTFFRVYNRYGQTVYEQNTCGSNGWDGTFKGIKQLGGAYVYHWQGVAFNGQTVSGNGSVILVR